MKKYLLTMLMLFINYLLMTVHSNGQSFTTKGTDFWLGFMENYLGDDTAGTDRMKVFITADNAGATGTLSVPLGGWSQVFVVAPNSTVEYTIPTNLVMCTASDTIENKGVHVISDNPVSVYQLNFVNYTSDANINIPTMSLGKKYITTTYQPSSNPLWTEVSVSEFLIVAAFDSTVIRIVPKCNTQGGHVANIPFIITLNQGEVYPVKSYVSSLCSLTGSLIELDTTVLNNDKPFAVFSGNVCAFVTVDTCCCEHLCEQMMPLNVWGKQFVTVPLKTRSSDIFRIVGQQNGTIFTINGGPSHLINVGDFYEESISVSSFIDSNYPISVAQFSESYSMDNNVDSDPFMMMINPLELSNTRVEFVSYPSTMYSAHYVNVVTRTDYKNMVTLDGINKGSSFSFVPNFTFYSYAQLPILPGYHILNSDSGLIANAYGYGNGTGYGYVAGASLDSMLFIGETELNGNSVSITFFPNPFSTYATLQVSKPLQSATLIIYDILGKDVKRMDGLGGKEIIIQRDGMKSGMCFYTLMDKQGVVGNGKMVVD